MKLTEVVLEVVWGTKISGKGTVVTGKILCDKIKVGSIVQVEDVDGNCLQETRIISIEMFNRTNIDEVNRDDEVGFLLRDMTFVPTKGMRIIRCMTPNGA